MLSQGKLLRNVLILNMDKQLEDISATMYEKKIEDLNSEELFIVVVFMVKRLIETFVRNLGEKKFYYISNNFSKGCFLENNLLNLGIYEVLEGVLASKGKDISELKKIEEEYMGRQQSFKETSYRFFEQSMQLGIPAEALGIRSVIRYEDRDKNFGTYEKEKSWLVKHDINYAVTFDGIEAEVTYYDMDVVGSDKEIYKFHLFDLVMEQQMDEEKLEILCDYFLVHCSVKLILQQMRSNQYDLRKMDSYARIGMEGKYISFVIPELIHVLVDEKAIPLTEAIEVVRKTCGYADYASMLEELEKCPVSYVEKLVPHLIETIKGM